jgi:hypothetical protein
MAKPTPPTLQTALQNWQQRSQFYNQLGIPQSQWYQIATSDIQNVANTGAEPMSTSQVNAAMASQVAGRSLIGNPVHRSHGLFGDIGRVFSSVPSDVSGLITGFLPGAARFATHLPSELTNTAQYITHGGGEQLLTMGQAPTSQSDRDWLTSHGYTDPTGGFLHRFAADLQNLAHGPVTSLIPGAADLANLTTSQGRQYLQSHPVSAALDVAPAGKILGAASKALLPSAEAGSAVGALQAGRPIVAASRGLTGAAREGKLGAVAERVATPGVGGMTGVSRWANELGVGEQAQALIRDYSVIGRKYSRRVKNQMADLRALTKDVPLDSMKRITDAATTVATVADDAATPLTAEEEAVLEASRQLRDTFRSYGQQQFKLSKGRVGLITRVVSAKHGTELTFTAADPIAKKVARIERLLSKRLPDAHTKRRHAETDEQRTRATVTRLQDELNLLRQRWPGMPVDRLLKDLSDAQDRHLRAKTLLTSRVAQHKRLQASLASTRADYNTLLLKGGGSAEMHPRVVRDMRQRMAEKREEMHRTELSTLSHLNDPLHPLYDPTTYKARVNEALSRLSADLSTINEGSNFRAMKRTFVDTAKRYGNATAKQWATGELNAMRTDIVKNVLNLISKGMDPIWLRHVDPGQEGRYEGRFAHRAYVIPDHVSDIKQYRRRVLNFAPQVDDIAMGLTSAARDLYSSLATDEFLHTHVVPYMRTVEDLEGQYVKIAKQDSNVRSRLPTRSISGHAQALMNDEWTRLDANSFGLADWSGYGRFSASSKVMIPKWMETNLKALMPSKDPERYHRLSPYAPYDRALRVFRFSVLTGPRHLVHVALGGLVPLMMREPFSPAHLASSLRILREVQAGAHEQTYARLSKNLYDFTDGVYSKAVGHQAGTWLRQFWEQTGGNVQQRLARLEETVSDMYRISAALAGERRGLSQEAAIARANKVAVDMDSMAPIERTVFKQIFPFYGFTKFLFRFLLQYPVDHPYRAAILSRFAAQEQNDWNSLIPEKFMLTMFLGQPDSHGNIKTVDLRNLNPFRSFSNDLTSVGFFQSLNPVASTVLATRGFNVLSAVGPLYPSLEYNASTGSLQASAPSGTDKLATAIQQFVPEFGALDHFVGITDQMRTLKRTNPAAYKAQLYSQLNLPGILSPPITVNLPYVEEKAEMDRYQAASQAVSKYEEGQPDTTTPTSFQVVPYEGQYVDPAAFEQYWQQLRSQTNGVDPRALLSTPDKRISKDPLEILTGLGGTPPPAPTPPY